MPPPDSLIYPPLLDLLLRHRAPVSAAELAARLDISTRRVLAEIARVGEAGCRLNVHAHGGLSLAHSGVAAWPDYLRWALSEGSDRTIEIYRQTASTQDIARRIVESRLPAAAHRALAIADEQTAGRGRLGRRWYAPPGTAVLMSYVHAPAQGTACGVDHLSLAAAVAVARAIDAVAGDPPLDVKVKWPNDVLVSGRKIAGILIEIAPRQAAVVGVGINVSLAAEHLLGQVDELAHRVSSLAMLGRPVDRLLVLTALVRRLDAALADASTEPLLAEWRRRSTLLGQAVRVRSDGQTLSGHVVDLDPTDGLILRTNDGPIIHLHAATTTVLDLEDV